LEELEKEMLNGQKLQGPETAKEVNVLLKAKGLTEEFVFLTVAIHKRCRVASQQILLYF
jgi:glycerol-3-phosphate dehydrogenase (NAD+)